MVQCLRTAELINYEPPKLDFTIDLQHEVRKITTYFYVNGVLLHMPVAFDLFVYLLFIHYFAMEVALIHQLEIFLKASQQKIFFFQSDLDT